MTKTAEVEVGSGGVWRPRLAVQLDLALGGSHDGAHALPRGVELQDVQNLVVALLRCAAGGVRQEGH